MTNVTKIGVVGAGQMGAGIAHVFALAGHDIVIHDIDENNIQQGIAGIETNMGRQVSKDVITEDEKNAAMARIGAAPKFEDLSDCDLVIEAATENIEIKKDLT